MTHEPVLLHEVLANLDLHPGLTVLDGTLGDGGHSRALGEAIGASGTLIGLDADPAAIERATVNLADLPCRKIFHAGNFREVEAHLDTLGIREIDRALLDLGLSSPQLADPTRGFSFQTDGPLTMTLDGKVGEGTNAAKLVNQLTAGELGDIIAEYGEEGYARRIAEAIVVARRHAPIMTTQALVEIIGRAVPKGYRSGRRHFATKTFQALRIATNDELGALRQGLADLWPKLASGGRLAVISFHSLEARIVKECFRNWSRQAEGILIHKHAVKPTREEEIKNPRSRSATLRIISKI